MGNVMMTQVIDHVNERAHAVPRLTAVRYEGTAVTYGDLDESIHNYSEVMNRHGMSSDASLIAAIVSSIPSVASLGERTGAAVSQMIEWLGRDLGTAGGGHLRAVV